VSFKNDLTAEVRSIFISPWEVQDANQVPAPEDLRLNQNHAKRLEDAVVLYADLDGSTSMVDQHSWKFSAEVYKAYLRSASQIIKRNSGTITAYDGDRVMAVFYDGPKNTRAVTAALELNYAVEEIIRPAYAFYGNGFVLKHVVGLDRSDLHAARIGVREDNDIVWVGRAANYAAKLCTLSEKPIWITEAVYNVMLDEVKYASGLGGSINMWELRYLRAMHNAAVYSTTYRRTFY
jgi:class 3 adenylate cyclase